MSSSVSLSRTNTLKDIHQQESYYEKSTKVAHRQRLNKAPVILNDGFSVVAPMS